MAVVRTVIVTISPMLSDILVTLLGDHTTLEVVATFDTRHNLEESLRAIVPDVILIGLGRNESDEIGHSCSTLLPTAKVIAFSNDGRNAFVHINAQRTVLLDVSAQMLTTTVLRV